MNDNVREDRTSVYEIGYLLAGLPEDRVAADAAGVKEIIAKNGGEVIAEEAPKHERLAYTMRKKTVSGSYDTYDEAYFGWIKFEASPSKLEAMKKAVEAFPTVLRMLAITTVREITYLGKRAPAIAATGYVRRPAAPEGDATAKAAAPAAAPATIEEMDKSIDEMVKEV